MFGKKFEFRRPILIRFSTILICVAVLPIVSATLQKVISDIWNVTLNKYVVNEDKPGKLMFDLWGGENCTKLLVFNDFTID